MRRRSFFSAIIVGLCILGNAASALALEVRREVLPSGLTVLHAERHNLPFVVVTLLVKGGARDEEAERAGLANLTASLLTEGTTGRTSVQISEEAEFIGAGLGASSGHDYSTVNLSVLKKDVGKGFELFSDVLLNPVFQQAEIDRVKALVKGSLKAGEDDPSFVAGKAFLKEVFGEHPYGRLVSGTPEGIDGTTREDIRAFYSNYYRPNNAVLAVAGDLSYSELEALINKYLGGWQKGDAPRRKAYALPKAARKVVAIDKDLTQASILLGHVGVSRGNPDYYAVTAMNFILGGGGFSSRLMETLRDRMGLTYGVYSSFSPGLEPGAFQVEVQTKNESANTAIEEIVREMERVREEGVAEAELSDAKAYLTGSFPRRLDTMQKVVDFMSQVEFYGLGMDYMERYPGLINSITLDDVRRVARKYLDPENYVLVVVARQSEAGVEAGR